MASLNKVMLIGNLTRDAELRYIPSGQAVLEFRLAVSRKFRKQDGTDGEETCFVDVNLWGKRGEAVSQYLTKGKPLFVEGRLQLDEWDDKQTGEKRSKLRVVADNIEFLGGSSGGSRSGSETRGAGDQQNGRGEACDAAGAPDAQAGPSGGPGGGPQRAPYAGGPRGGGGPNAYGGGNGGNGGHGAPAPARSEPYARPATAPGGSAASAMQLAEGDIPF